MPQRRRCVLLIAIIVIHRHVNYTGGYKRQYDRPCRPGACRGQAWRFCWLLRRPVKVKSLVCLNQCARKRPSYLCPIITETSSTSQTFNPTPGHPLPPSTRPLPAVSSPSRCVMVRSQCWKVATSQLRYPRASHACMYKSIRVITRDAHKAANDRVGVTFNLFTTRCSNSG